LSFLFLSQRRRLTLKCKNICCRKQTIVILCIPIIIFCSQGCCHLIMSRVQAHTTFTLYYIFNTFQVINAYLHLVKRRANDEKTKVFVIPSYTGVLWQNGSLDHWMFKKVAISIKIEDKTRMFKGYAYILQSHHMWQMQ